MDTDASSSALPYTGSAPTAEGEEEQEDEAGHRALPHATSKPYNRQRRLKAAMLECKVLPLRRMRSRKMSQAMV